MISDEQQRQAQRDARQGSDMTQDKSHLMSEAMARQEAENPLDKQQGSFPSVKVRESGANLYESARDTVREAYGSVADVGHKVGEAIAGAPDRGTAAEPAAAPHDEYERPEAKAGGFKLGEEKEAQRSAEVENVTDLGGIKDPARQAQHDEYERPEPAAGGFTLGEEKEAQRSAEIENAQGEAKEKSTEAALYSA